MLPSHPFPHHGWERAAALGLGLLGGPRWMGASPAARTLSLFLALLGQWTVFKREGGRWVSLPFPGVNAGEKVLESGLCSVTEQVTSIVWISVSPPESWGSHLL